MHDKLMKMMMKKKGSDMNDNEMSAKRSVLHDMKKMAEDAMADKVKGLKKVEVASTSPEGLTEGLDKAKELLGKGHMEEESPEEEASETSDEEMQEDHDEEYSDAEEAIENCSDSDELDKLEQMIKAKKMELMKK